MKIYTKRGDQGDTDLLAGVRVPKDDLRIESYGAIDELNAVLGICAADEGVPPILRGHLARIQSELFQLGTELATPSGKKLLIEPVAGDRIEVLESEIDAMESELEPLKNFILPGGTRAAANLHLARTTCRRAERRMVSLGRVEKLREEPIRYINRLSDYLFVCARWVNLKAGKDDVPWLAPRKTNA